MASYTPGQPVEYLSGSLNAWVPAVVQSYNPDGSINLNVKCAVPSQRIRIPTNSVGLGIPQNPLKAVLWRCGYRI
jgi:hypothetical protein